MNKSSIFRLASTAGFLLLFLSGCSSAPSDDALIRRFHNSYSSFDRLRQMVDEDNLNGRVHADYADPALSAARLGEYRNLMKIGGIERLWAHGKSKPFSLDADADGFLAQGDYKGYVYDLSMQQPPSPSLDLSCFDIAEATKTERSCSAVRPLSGGWWLIAYEYR